MTNRHKDIAIKILKIAGIGALFTAASLLNPLFPYSVLREYLKREYKKDYSKRQLQNAVRYLKQKRFIAYTNGEFTITKTGKKHLELALIKDLKIQKVKWDHKWRFITFDIPEEIKSSRHVFRHKLIELGFYNFQRSLFVYPYPCEQEIAALVDLLAIVPHVHLFTAERFTNDAKLAKHFSLL